MFIKKHKAPSDFNISGPDNLTYHKATPSTTSIQRMAGFCTNGHIFRFHGFIDSEGKWRCRICRSEQERDRDFWRLVALYTATEDPAVLEELQRSHWTTP
jgi:hypothetical protein